MTTQTKFKKYGFFFGILLPMMASAYQLPILNGQSINVEPGVLGRIIKNQQPPQTQATTVVPSQPKQTQETSPIPLAEAKKVSLFLNKVVFKGNHVFTDTQLQALFKPYLHQQITLAQFLQGLQAVTDLYQNNGYFLSKALLPPQAIVNGVVQVTVVEGFINQVEVQGVTGKKRDMLLKYGAAIEQIRPIKLADLERYLLLINDIPGIQVKSVIEPDPKVPLGSKLSLVTQYSPLQTVVTHDNYQTLYLGPQETTVYASLNSFITPGGTLAARVLEANTAAKLKYYELQYKQVVGINGLVLGIDGANTITHPGFILTPLEILGSSANATFNATYPIIRSRQQSFYVTGQFDYMNNFSNFLGEQLYYDKIRDFTLSGQFNNTVWKGDNSVVLALDKGFNILGANGRGFRSRADASSEFFKANLTVSRDQSLGSHLSAFILVTSQYANRALLAAEQMVFGGPSIGRGYDMAQFIGDQGVAGKAELRWTTAPNWKIIKQVQYYTFYDAGMVTNYLSGSLSMSGTSTGAGLRSSLFSHVNIEGFLAKPLTAPNATQVILQENGKAAQAYFQVTGFWNF